MASDKALQRGRDIIGTREELNIGCSLSFEGQNELWTLGDKEEGEKGKKITSSRKVNVMHLQYG